MGAGIRGYIPSDCVKYKKKFIKVKITHCVKYKKKFIKVKITHGFNLLY